MVQLIPLSSTFFINVSDSLRVYYPANVEQQGWPTFFRVNIDNIFRVHGPISNGYEIESIFELFWEQLVNFCDGEEVVRVSDAGNAYG